MGEVVKLSGEQINNFKMIWNMEINSFFRGHFVFKGTLLYPPPPPPGTEAELPQVCSHQLSTCVMHYI